MNADAKQAKAIFLEAVEQHAPEQWPAFLDRACAGQDALRRQVEKLLEAHREAGTAQHQASHEGSAPEDGNGPSEHAGSVIGPYKLLEQIGEGGMGSVWMAQQQEPVKRLVALKLVKAGMDSKQVLTRFEAERQALALMDHPNIARVFDAGTVGSRQSAVSSQEECLSSLPSATCPPPSGEGRPYFVMELVKGVPITKYCDEHRLTPKQRLELFVPVCQAIQHAHQKGIIHRDIKPSNVLVASYDGRSVPKVIDFGIAKAAGQPLTEKTLVTGFGMIVGTLEYMSPEQAMLNALDIDTRSDVYSLGVLLYELLTGTTPFETKRLQKAAFDEVLRIIRKEEPPRPSTRLSTTDEAPSVAANRGMEPKKLSALVRGELDWIVMKSLEKDRDRRYESANGLAHDIERFLNDEPVQAGPPSTVYRLRKFLRRHRGPVLVVAVVLLALLGGIVGTSVGLVRAEYARQNAEKAEANEREQRRVAEQEKLIAQSVRDFLQKRLLLQADASIQADTLLRGGGTAAEVAENPTIRELLDRAARELTPERIEKEFPRQPLVQAEILATIGNAYRGVAVHGPAIDHLKRSHLLRHRELGPDHPNTLTTLVFLAVAYQHAGNFAEAIRLFEQVREVQLDRLGPAHRDTLNTLNQLAWSYLLAGRVRESVSLLEQARDSALEALGPADPTTLDVLGSLGVAYFQVGKFSQAMVLHQQVRDRRSEQLGADHPVTLHATNDLALDYGSAGQMEKAIRLFEHVRDKRVKFLGSDHPLTLKTLHDLAHAYLFAGKVTEGLRLFEQVRDRYVARLGPEHLSTLIATANLGEAYMVAGKRLESVRLLEQVCDAEVRLFGADHQNTLGTQHLLARTYLAMGRIDEAIRLLEQVRDARTKKLGADHPSTLGTVHDLAGAYLPAGKVAEAIRLLEQTRDGTVKALGVEHKATLEVQFRLAGAYGIAGKLPESIRQLEEVRQRAIALLGADDPLTLFASAALASMYHSTKQLDKSVPLLEEVVRRYEAKRGPNHPHTLAAIAHLAVNYRDAGRPAKALTLLEDALKRARKIPGALPAEVALISEALLETYEALGMKDEAARLRKELEASKPSKPTQKSR
jgi:serine/threonine protein kinase/tetratricopeptide (TPR) repeat protein